MFSSDKMFIKGYIAKFNVVYLKLKKLNIFFWLKISLYRDKLLDLIDYIQCNLYNLLKISIILIIMGLLVVIIFLMVRQPDLEPESTSKSNHKPGQFTSNNLSNFGGGDDDDTRNNVGSVIVAATTLIATKREANNNAPGSSEQSNINTLPELHSAHHIRDISELKKETTDAEYNLRRRHKFILPRHEILDNDKLIDLTDILELKRQEHPEFNLNAKTLAHLHILSYDTKWLGAKAIEGSYEEAQGQIIKASEENRSNSVIAPKYRQAVEGLSRDQLDCYFSMLDYMQQKDSQRKSINR